jgi:hypothetical protein
MDFRPNITRTRVAFGRFVFVVNAIFFSRLQPEH